MPVFFCDVVLYLDAHTTVLVHPRVGWIPWGAQILYLCMYIYVHTAVLVQAERHVHHMWRVLQQESSKALQKDWP